eukprot:TRINITY_DN1455_c0_g1_i1.p1 TRINITY_DN1455_c0_g1~~TRINITY_DN1455_c0_g1_i1.p1  ORF type:complete len:408 (+),score=126.68 TRINITY_DN1455_c0_g1_i1:3-1226(+)
MQIFIKTQGGRTRTLFTEEESISVAYIKSKLSDYEGIPVVEQRLTCGRHELQNTSMLSGDTMFFLSLSLRVLGGKGGFGSLLRGGSTKVGQKKTTNFDACRDLSGRRLRHVNNEKKLAEWFSQQDERDLEKKALQFISTNVKKHEFDERKYTAESEKINTSVSEAIAKGITTAKESSVLSVSKKRAVEERAAMKKRAVWEDDDFLEQDEEGEENMPPVKKQKKEATKQSSSSDYSFTSDAVASAITSTHDDYVEDPTKIPLPRKQKQKTQQESTTTTTTEHKVAKTAREAYTTTLDWLKSEDYPLKAEDLEVRSRIGINVSLYDSIEELQEKHSADEIKNELQRLGLICGGRPEDRAQRLFLLKEMPLSRLPKKLFAKKSNGTTSETKRNGSDSLEFPDAGIQIDMK